MDIIINIPKEEYECVKRSGFINHLDIICNAISNGLILEDDEKSKEDK